MSISQRNVLQRRGVHQQTSMLDLLAVGRKFTPSEWHYAADDAHRPQLQGFAAAARAAPVTDRQTDRRTPHRVNMLTAYAVRAVPQLEITGMFWH